MEYSFDVVLQIYSHEPYFIIGAYDGNGSVRMWINNDDTGVTETAASGGVEVSNSPVVLGADPQGANARRYFFSGKIQQAQVQRWGAH